jgi:hypothetical protein
MSIEDEKGKCCETDYLNWCMQNGWRVIRPAYKYHPGNDLFVNDKLIQIKGQIPWWIKGAFTFSKEQYHRYMKMSQVPEVIFYDVDNLRIQKANLLRLADENVIYFEKQRSKDEDLQACIPMNKTTFVKNITDEWTLKEIIRLWGKEIQYNKKYKKQGDYYAL